MKKRNFGKGILGAAAMVVLAGTSSAAEGNWTEIRSEIDSCVAAVAEHANYDDATRVRHEVVDIKERTVGYKLTIATSVYTESGDAAIRAYATSCVVNGNHVPMIFEISESNDGA
jgi:hypothetical protein